MSIDASVVKELRDKTGAGMMDCKKALVETSGNIDKAVDYLRKSGIAKAEKKGDRTAKEGLVFSYIHHGGRLGVLVELNCETDFVARTDEFGILGRNIAMQVAAMNPIYLDRASIPEDVEDVKEEELLNEQEYIRDSSMKITDLVKESIGKLGENIRIRRFSRFELGD